jgi:N-acetylmuramoyl-L-alanine amidase
VLASVTAHAQTPPSATAVATAHKPKPKTQPAYNPNVILLDPAHGGADNGATLGENSLEKDTTVAFADRLKTLLAARGFTVVLTHDSAGDQVAPDQRAEAANRSRAVACLVLHGSNGGHGVHLFTSSLPALTLMESVGDPPAVLPWDTAQAAAIPQSLLLAKEISDAFSAIRVPLTVGHASVAPIDAMTCPVVALEISPLAATGDDGTPTPASDPGYQQRIADALVTALNAWRGDVVAKAAAANEAANPPAKPAVPPVRKPKPVPIPIEKPDMIPATPKPNPTPGAPQ